MNVSKFTCSKYYIRLPLQTIIFCSFCNHMSCWKNLCVFCLFWLILVLDFLDFVFCFVFKLTLFIILDILTSKQVLILVLVFMWHLDSYCILHTVGQYNQSKMTVGWKPCFHLSHKNLVCTSEGSKQREDHVFLLFLLFFNIF